jgi:hypothetical protein
MAENEIKQVEHLNLLNISQINTSFNSIKNEINKLCKRGEYDLDDFNKINNDIQILSIAIDTLNKCQAVLLNLSKKN